MQLVADTNIILGGLLKPSVTQKMLFSEKLSLSLPEYSLAEIEKHSGEFARRMGKTRAEFETSLTLILSNIAVVPCGEYAQLKQRALHLCPQGHEDDWPFLALALKLSCPLWSNDAALKKQGEVRVFSTAELLKRMQ